MSYPLQPIAFTVLSSGNLFEADRLVGIISSIRAIAN